jgi:CheY-like chemotaxis protein
MAPQRVLIAEDNAVNLFLATAQLKKLGYAADSVTNGLEVLAALDKIPYDIILMDCQMLELDGYETTRRIRSQSGHQPLIIATTANAMLGDRALCLAAGMDSYLSKPMRIADLRSALDEAAGADYERSAPAKHRAEVPFGPARSGAESIAFGALRINSG